MVPFDWRFWRIGYRRYGRSRTVWSGGLWHHLGLTANAGTFSTYLSRLRSNGLVTVSGGEVELTEILR